MSFTAPARRLLTALAALAVLAVGAPSTASAAPASAFGKLDSVKATAFSDAVVLTGWAMDRSARGRSVGVMVTVDGHPRGGWRSTAVTRPDVNRAYSTAGAHGFNITTLVPPGSHTVCLVTRPVATAAPTTSLGCFAFRAYPMATKAQMLAIAKTIDPRGTIGWSWASLPTGASGRSEPWARTIQISVGNTTRYLRAVMLHEWSHVLQYRAFGTIDPWSDAVQAFNALLGHPGDRHDYTGVEHGADCIALALGAGYLGYGCPVALRAFGARIAHGASMSQPTGKLDSAKLSGLTATLTGWALDPANPTTSGSIEVTDNGHAVTGRITTTVNRADVNAANGVTGRHGFQVRITLQKGSHHLCVLAAATTVGRAAVSLSGCTTVTS